MFVKEYGRGQREFLCFHGWGGDHREFAPLASPAPRKWSLDEIVTEAILILENRDSQLCGLVGFCSGAGLALMVAARAPAKVERVVMIDPFAFVPWYFRIFLSGGRQKNH